MTKRVKRSDAKIARDVDWVQRPDARGLKDLDLLPIPRLDVDPSALLIADRKKDRGR